MINTAAEGIAPLVEDVRCKAKRLSFRPVWGLPRAKHLSSPWPYKLGNRG